MKPIDEKHTIPVTSAGVKSQQEAKINSRKLGFEAEAQASPKRRATMQTTTLPGAVPPAPNDVDNDVRQKMLEASERLAKHRVFLLPELSQEAYLRIAFSEERSSAERDEAYERAMRG